MPTYEFQVFTPRWGHTDLYKVDLQRGEMSISVLGKKSTLPYVEGSDPIWQHSDTSLFHMFENDAIYAPHVFPDALQYLWLRWRDNGLTDEEADTQLGLLFEWLNGISRSKPKSDFWKSFF